MSVTTRRFRSLVKRAQIKENCKGLWASRLYFLSLWCFGVASGGREGSLEREKEIRLSFSSTLEVKKALTAAATTNASSFFLLLMAAMPQKRSLGKAVEVLQSSISHERDDAL